MKTFKQPIHVGFPIALLCLFATISGRAEDIPAQGPIPFTAYDKDGDGLIGAQEFNVVREERMATRAAEGRPMRGMANAPAFTEFDTNADGKLTRDELATGQQAQMEKRSGTGMGRGRGMGGGAGRNMPAFSEYDLDGDGKIVEMEFSEARQNRITERAKQGYPMRNLGDAPLFADIDVNGDGGIGPDEFTAHQSQRRQQILQ